MSDLFFSFVRRPSSARPEPRLYALTWGFCSAIYVRSIQSISCSLSTNGAALRLVKIVAVPMPLLHS